MELCPEQTHKPKMHHYKFIAVIKRINLKMKFQCSFKVIWKRGSKISQTKSLFILQKGDDTLNQEISYETNMLMLPNNNIYQEKLTKIIVLIYSAKGNKQAGQFYFDVASILNNSHLLNKALKYKLDKCPDPNASVQFQVTPQFISQINLQQYQQSIITKSRSLDCHLSLQICNFKKKSVPMETEANIKSPLKETNNTRYSLRRSQSNVTLFQSKLNSIKLEKLTLESRELNKQYNEYKQIQLKNKQLKKQIINKQAKLIEHYAKQFKQIQQLINNYKIKNKEIIFKQQRKSLMEMQLHQSKESMGRILNFTMIKGLYNMTDELFNIFGIHN